MEREKLTIEKVRECWLSSLIVKIQIEENRVFHEIVLCTKKKTICLASSWDSESKKSVPASKKIAPLLCMYSLSSIYINLTYTCFAILAKMHFCSSFLLWISKLYIFTNLQPQNNVRGLDIVYFINYMYCIRWNSHCNSSCSQKWKVCKIHRIRTYFDIQIIIIWSVLFYAVYHR